MHGLTLSVTTSDGPAGRAGVAVVRTPDSSGCAIGLFDPMTANGRTVSLNLTRVQAEALRDLIQVVLDADLS